MDAKTFSRLTQKSQADLDQTWAEAKSWINTSNPIVTRQLVDALVNDDLTDLIKWMSEDKDLACIVANLAFLALKQCAVNSVKE